MESIEKLDLDKTESEQYESTKMFELKKWLKRLPQDIEYNAIDFGSGKGRVLVELSNHENFKKVIGIEISSKLNAIAERNIKIEGCNNINVLTCNAIDTPSEILICSNFFFFYNPFPYKVFKEVFKKIETSLQSENKRCVIVYFNPVYSNIIESSSFFEKKMICKNALSNADTYIYLEGFNCD